MAGPTRKISSPTPPRRRAVAPEERALWQTVVRDATPLDPGRPEPAEPAGAPPAPPPPVTASEPAPPPRLPQRLRPAGSERPAGVSLDLADREVGPVGRPAAGLDRRNAERLRRGEREPDARIDLHGMTAARAHHALDRRVAASLAAGHRLVLVVTGKGGKRRNPDDAPFMRDDRGVLRQQVPAWLRSGPHGRSIVGVYQAHPRHGGEGALYVYLKKRR